MAYTEHETLMMQVIENLNNRIRPIRVPQTDGFLTPEVISELLEAITYNHNAKCYYHVSYVCTSPYRSGALSIFYFPYDMPTEYFKHTKDMIILPHEVSTFINSEYPNNPQLYYEFINELEIAHDLGLEPYIHKLEDGLYSTAISTRKDHPFEPLNIKSFELPDVANSVSLHEAFGYEMPPPNSIGSPWKFTTGSLANYNGSHAPLEIRMFRARQSMGLIIKPGKGQEPLPYHNKSLYYANPHYGYYDNYYDVSPFQSTERDKNGKPLIKGHTLASGFTVVWFDDSNFWITPKYKVIYSDRRDSFSQELNNKCCLMECFGITE